MATAKLATLVIRTIAKPISNQLKQQAKEHETFRKFCVSIAQSKYRAEVQLRTNLLGEPAKSVRPLSEVKAIENGANTLAEGFLFSVAALIILGESWRSSRSQAKRRDAVDDQIDELSNKLRDLTAAVERIQTQLKESWEHQQERNNEHSRILERIVDIGLRGGWAELEDTPLKLPRILLAPPLQPNFSTSPDASHQSSQDTDRPDNKHS